MHAASRKASGMGVFKPFETTVAVTKYGSRKFGICLMNFGFSLAQYILILFLFSPFGEEMYSPCQCVLEACNLLFNFIRGDS